jgi:WD40 repeat protein
VEALLHFFNADLLGVVTKTEKDDFDACATRFLKPWSDQVLLTIQHPDEAVIQIDRSSPAKWIATASRSRREVRMWSLVTFQALRTIRLDPEPSDLESPNVALSRTGRWLAWTSAAGVEVLDVNSGTRRTVSKAADFDLAPNERLLATSLDGQLVLRRLDDLKSVFTHKFTGYRFWNRPASPYDPRFLTDDILRMRLPRSYIVLDTRSRTEREIGRSGSGYVQTKMLGSDLLARAARGGSTGRMEINDARAPGMKLLYTLSTRYIDGVSRSGNGSLIAVPTGATTRLLEARTGHERAKLVGHLGDVLTTAFSHDDKRLLTGSADGSLRLWDVATSKTIVTLIASNDGRWLALTPEGFFAASSPAAAELQSIVSGLTSRGIDQVWQSLYNPDLVRAKLAGDEKEVQSAANVLALDKVLASGEPPTLTMLSPAATSKSNEESVTAEVRVTEGDSGSGRIEWRLNGLTVAVSSRPDGAGREYKLKREIALDAGENVIEVVAYNKRNTLSSPAVRTTVVWEAPATRPLPTLHALVVGVDSYNDQRFTLLKYARSDAVAVAQALARIGSDRTLYGANPKIILLPETQATRAGIEAAIKEISKGMHARDTFVLFLAGHGTSSEGRFYMIPFGFQSDPNALVSAAIGQDQLQEWLANRIVAKRSLILLDTCASGALVGGAQYSRVDAPDSEAAVGRLHEATGRPVLTASATGKAAIEGYKDHGVFTYAILEALSKGDTNGDGQVDLHELVAHVQKRVPQVSAEVGATGVGRGAITRPIDSAAPKYLQSARYGSRGDNFVLGKVLP